MYNGLSQIYCIKPEGSIQKLTKGEATSFLFLSKMIARLEWTPRTTSQSKYQAHTQTKHPAHTPKNTNKKYL